MRVKVVANRLSDVHPASGIVVQGSKDDIITVEDSHGKYLCDQGWVEDVSGEYASAPFTPGAVAVRAHRSTHRTKKKEVENE